MMPDLVYLSDEEAAEIMESLGKKTIDQSEFFGWVCNHVRPKNPEKLTVVKGG